MHAFSQSSSKYGSGKNVQLSWSPTTRLLLPENLGTHCREWPTGITNTKIQMLVKANSKPHDIVIYTDSSVTRDLSGWGFTIKQPVLKTTPTVTTSSLTMEVEAVTHAIQWLSSQRDRLYMPLFSHTLRTCCKRSSLEWAVLTGT